MEILERFCPECPGRKFEGLQDHSEHLATHNLSPGQWTEVYRKIQAGKERAKKAEKVGE